MFPGRKHLDMTNDMGYTVLHFAVYHSNVLAIEIIRDHLLGRGEILDPNITHNGGPPPLHGLGMLQEKIRLKEEDATNLFSIIKRNTAKTYELMRNLGAYRLDERDGAMVCIFTRRQNELSKQRLLLFLEAMREKHHIEWEFVDAEIPSAKTGTPEAMFVVELCWAFDHFVLQAMPLSAEKLPDHVTERTRRRTKMTKGETECKLYRTFQKLR